MMRRSSVASVIIPLRWALRLLWVFIFGLVVKCWLQALTVSPSELGFYQPLSVGVAFSGSKVVAPDPSAIPLHPWRTSLSLAFCKLCLEAQRKYLLSLTLDDVVEVIAIQWACRPARCLFLRTIPPKPIWSNWALSVLFHSLFSWEIKKGLLLCFMLGGLSDRIIFYIVPYFLLKKKGVISFSTFHDTPPNLRGAVASHSSLLASCPLVSWSHAGPASIWNAEGHFRRTYACWVWL